MPRVGPDDGNAAPVEVRGERELGEENIDEQWDMMSVTGSPFSLVHLHLHSVCETEHHPTPWI